MKSPAKQPASGCRDRTNAFDKDKIRTLFEANLKEARAKLAELKVYCGREPGFAGLSGWVFEQTIQHCIRKELEAQGLRPSILEQVSLGGRAKADLAIGDIAVEIKTSGLFEMDAIRRYELYRKAAKNIGLRYVFLTWGESYRPYRDGIIRALGRPNVFFLNKPREWERLVMFLVRKLNDKAQRPSSSAQQKLTAGSARRLNRPTKSLN